jgi:hypothetical protein
VQQVAIPHGGLRTDYQDWIFAVSEQEVAIPHGGLRTSSLTQPCRQRRGSPSHTVGLEQFIRELYSSVVEESPSHTVGLER